MRTGKSIFLGIIGNEYQSSNGKDLLKMDLEALDTAIDEHEEKVEDLEEQVDRLTDEVDERYKNVLKWKEKFIDNVDEALADEDMEDEAFQMFVANNMNELIDVMQK